MISCPVLFSGGDAMTDAEIVKILAERVMGWTWNPTSEWVKKGPFDDDHPAWESGGQLTAGRFWNPQTSWEDCMEAEDAIMTLPFNSKKRREYVAEICNRIVGGRAVVGVNAIREGLLRADKRTRCLAMVEAVRGGK